MGWRRGRRRYGVYYSTGKYMIVYSATLGDGRYPASPHTVIHELGHHVHLRRLTQTAGFDWDSYSRRTPKAARICAPTP